MIREAVISDLPQVLSLALESLELGPYKDVVKRNPAQAETLARQLITEDKGIVLISEENGKANGLFGFVVFPHFYSGEMTAGELIWYVTPDARLLHAFGDGIAFRLLEAGEKKAFAMGAKTMQLGAPTEQVGKLYQRKGYSQIEVTYRRELVCP